MSRVVALIDGEHYPPVVRFAIESLGRDHEVVAAAFVGGTEKVDLASGADHYGVPTVWAESADAALANAIEKYAPDAVVDLSDEPVLSATDRFRLASAALHRGVGYQGADFSFRPPSVAVVTRTPALGIIGTGKRVGKTSVSAHTARLLKGAGREVVVLAMGRGGPPEPELIHGDQVELRTPDLLALAQQGKHAASDNYEDAVMARVTTVGCRRCGGGLAGETFFSNVPEGARLADSLGKEIVVLEGSGAAIPPVAADANILVVGAGRGEAYVRDHFGPFRLARADLVVIAGAEAPLATSEEVEAIRRAVASLRPDVRCVASTFRPSPLESIAGTRVFFATTAPASLLDAQREHLEREFDCEVVGASAHLSNRAVLREDMARYAGEYDLLLTELKAAAVDVVAAAGAEAGVQTVLCDNVPVAVDDEDLDAALLGCAELAVTRGRERSG